MKLLLRFAKKYSWALSITVLSMLLLVGAQLLIPWLIKTLIALVTEEQLSPDTMKTVSYLTLIALITFIARGVVQFFRSYMAHIAGWGWYPMRANMSTNTFKSFRFVFMKINKPVN